MALIQGLARAASGFLGRDSGVVRAMRPWYERLLDVVSGGRGYLRVVNGRERFYVNPHARGLFPEVYEPAVCAYLRERLVPGAVSLNVGAHLGIYALCLARWSQPNGRVVAFEPNPATRAVLVDHVRRNDLAGNVTVEPLAVAAAPGTAVFYAAGLEGTSRLDAPSPERHLEHRALETAVTSIDAYCAAHGLAPNWIVMDIEGYEIAALEGARRTIAARGADLGLVVEMHPTLWPLSGLTRQMVEQRLADLGLVARPLTGQADPLGEAGVVAFISPAFERASRHSKR